MTVTEISINFRNNSIEISRLDGLRYTCVFEVRDDDELLRAVPLIKSYFNAKYKEMEFKLQDD